MMFEKKVSKKAFDEVRNDLWKLQDKVEELFKLLGVGFTADKDYPTARYLDLDRRPGIKMS